jgi:hypothetical protein
MIVIELSRWSHGVVLRPTLERTGLNALLSPFDKVRKDHQWWYEVPRFLISQALLLRRCRLRRRRRHPKLRIIHRRVEFDLGVRPRRDQSRFN